MNSEVHRFDARRTSRFAPLVLASTLVVLVGTFGSTEVSSAATRSASTPPQTRSTARTRSSATTFCQHLSTAKIDSIVATTVRLVQTSTKDKILACIYQGPKGTLSIETQTDLPAASTSSLTAAEASTKAKFPSGQKITFAAVSSLGPTAYTWSTVIAGTAYHGLTTNKGTTGFFIEMSGAFKLAQLESLVKLEITEK